MPPRFSLGHWGLTYEKVLRATSGRAAQVSERELLQFVGPKRLGISHVQIVGSINSGAYLVFAVKPSARQSFPKGDVYNPNRSIPDVQAPISYRATTFLCRRSFAKSTCCIQRC